MPAISPAVTEARRRLIVRALGSPELLRGATPREVEIVLKLWIDRRIIDWPHGHWHDARNEPYAVGIRQHLDAMWRLNIVSRMDERPMRYKLYGGRCPSCSGAMEPGAVVCLVCRERNPDELLPPDTFKAYIERARVYGHELAFGVTPDFKRVIRVDVGRGYYDYDVGAREWLEALREVAAEIGVPIEEGVGVCN